MPFFPITTSLDAFFILSCTVLLDLNVPLGILYIIQMRLNVCIKSVSIEVRFNIYEIYYRCMGMMCCKFRGVSLCYLDEMLYISNRKQQPKYFSFQILELYVLFIIWTCWWVFLTLWPSLLWFCSKFYKWRTFPLLEFLCSKLEYLI